MAQWSEFHDRHEGFDEVLVERVPVDAFPLDREAVRKKAHAWLHEDEEA